MPPFDGGRDGTLADDAAGADAAHDLDAPPGDGTADADAAPVVHGTITIRCLPGAHVLLGDGTRFDAVVPDSGVVTFRDPSLVGPQTVTCIATDPHTFPDYEATTIASIDQETVVVESEPPPQAAPPLLFRITGTVSLVPDAAIVVDVQAAGHGTSGVAYAASDGTYALDVYGPADASSTDIVATARADGTILSVGMARDVPVPAPAGVSDGEAPVVTGADLMLDHPCDQPLSVTAANLSPYAPTPLAVDLDFVRDGTREFGQSVTAPVGSPTVVTYGIALTPPFDVFSRIVSLQTASIATPSNGATATLEIPADASAVSLAFPPPVTITAPANVPYASNLRSPDVAIDSGFRVGWQVTDPATQTVTVNVTCLFPGNYGNLPSPGVSWTVTSPVDAGGFAFVPPPADTTMPFFCTSEPVTIRVTAGNSYANARFNAQ